MSQREPNADGKTLDGIGPGDVVVTEPVENVEVEAHGLADDDPGMVLFTVAVETDGGLLESIVNLRLVGVSDEEGAFYAAPMDHSNAHRVHDSAVRAIEEMGGAVVNDKTEVPA